MKLLARMKRLATPGHALATVIMLVVVYQAWGRVFTPGGTGSNVVLGLLVAIAAIYVGATNVGPWIDDLTAPKMKRARRALREGDELDREVELLIERARKGKEKGLDAKQVDAIAAAHAAFHQALLDAAKPASAQPTDAQLVHLEAKSAELASVLQRELGKQKASTAFFAQARSLGLAFAVAVALRLFLVAPFQIPSGSMIPTLLIGDHLFVFRAMYGLMSPFGDEPSYLLRWSMPQPATSSCSKRRRGCRATPAKIGSSA